MPAHAARLIRRVHHVAVIAGDYVRSRRFYVDVLGLAVIGERVQPHRGTHKLDLAAPCGTQIELFEFPSAPPRPSYPEARGLRHLAFGVEDLDAMRSHLQAHAVAMQDTRVDEYTGRRFFFAADPDALPIEFYELGAG